MVKEDRQTWKANYFLRIKEYFETYKSVFIVGADNVRSSQMQQIRRALRGKAVLLMGKNTMIRKALRGFMSSVPQLDRCVVKGFEQVYVCPAFLS
jgi:large subunit ribosomal protein LP0